MKKYIKLLSLFLVLVLYSCGGNSDYSYSESAESLAEDIYMDDEKEIEDNPEIQDRKIIKEGNIKFKTSDATKTRQLIEESLQKYKGYLSADNIYDYNSEREYVLTIRVPNQHFEDLLNDISNSADKIDSKDISARDVTEEFIDIEARLNTKKELEDRYKDLLKQAKNVEEILSIEREIANLRADIESMEGRLNYLKNRVSLSTLTVRFYEETTSSFGFGEKSSNAIKNGWSNMLWFFIGLLNLWPFMLFGALLIFVFKVIRKKKQPPKLRK